MNVYVLLLVGYAARLVGLGFGIGRRTRQAADFFVAGRRLGPGLLFATMLAANIGAGSTVGATGLGYRDGIAAWWWGGSTAIGTAVLAFWAGPALRRASHRLGLRAGGGCWGLWQTAGAGWPFLMLLGPAFAVSPGLLEKVYGARADAAARRGAGATALALLLYAWVPPFLGILARSRFPDLASPQLALPMLLSHPVPPALAVPGV